MLLIRLDREMTGIIRLISIGKYHIILFKKADSSYDGVLGGFGNLSSLDTNYSLRVLLRVFQQKKNMQRNSVLDCGAGIGRISKELLCQVFKTVFSLIK